jgi:NADH:ubiquinone oxidoreductase subunit C
LEKENDIIEKLKAFLGEELLEVKIPRARRIFVKIEKTALKKTVSFMIENLEIGHLSTITGVDLGEEIEIIYHLAYKGAIEVSLRLSVPKKEPKIPTITDLIPGAVLYEREVHDLFGVEFEGHPDLSPLILPEGWPEGLYPLRKEFSLEDLRKAVLKEER